VKSIKLSGIKEGNILKEKFISLKQTVRTKILETYVGHKMNLGRVMTYELLTKSENGHVLADFLKYFEQMEELLLSAIECMWR
jgi:hypothetical protein